VFVQAPPIGQVTSGALASDDKPAAKRDVSAGEGRRP